MNINQIAAARIRTAASGPAPEMVNCHTWLGMAPGTGPCPIGKMCDEYLDTLRQLLCVLRWDDQRTFLLLCAEAIEFA
jgi:hypothetical protein